MENYPNSSLPAMRIHFLQLFHFILSLAKNLFQRASVDKSRPRRYSTYTGVMGNKQYLLYAGALAAVVLLGAVIYVSFFTPGGNESTSPADIGEALKNATVDTPAVAPSANPLKQVAPTENPIEKTNPFKNEYKNPFE